MELIKTKIDTYGIVPKLADLWDKAEKLYREGNRDPENYFGAADISVLTSLGLGVMDVYDYVEDFVTSGDPQFGDFLLITFERVSFFLGEMKGELSSLRIESENLPPKPEEIAGVPWLPRILVKAKAKLRGQLPSDIMYGCGGDRRFLRVHGIHPAEFLRKVRVATTDQEVVDWVISKKN